MGKFATFRALDRADRVATLEALWDLAFAQWQVRAVPPRRWRSRFGSLGPVTSDAIPREQLGQIRRVRLAVARVARSIPTSPNCLPQALAARSMLARRGIEASLYLGTERDEAGVPRFHAWLKVGPEWVTGLCDESRYALLVPGEPEPA